MAVVLIPQPKRGRKMSDSKKKSIKDIEKELGFDRICPISPSPSISADMLSEPGDYKELYEEELRKYYEKVKKK